MTSQRAIELAKLSLDGLSVGDAIRTTLQGMGDSDTTCAIVGGIVSLKVGEVPQSLLNRMEPLPPLSIK